MASVGESPRRPANSGANSHKLSGHLSPRKRNTPPRLSGRNGKPPVSPRAPTAATPTARKKKVLSPPRQTARPLTRQSQGASFRESFGRPFLFRQRTSDSKTPLPQLLTSSAGTFNPHATAGKENKTRKHKYLPPDRHSISSSSRAGSLRSFGNLQYTQTTANGETLAREWLNAEYEQISLVEVLESIRSDTRSPYWVTPRRQEPEENLLARSFRALLSNQTGLATFTNFLVNCLALENMFLYQQAELLILKPTLRGMQEFATQFLDDQSDLFVNLSSSTQQALQAGLEKMGASFVVSRDLIKAVRQAQKEVYKDMSEDLFTKFLHSDDARAWKAECKRAVEAAAPPPEPSGVHSSFSPVPDSPQLSADLNPVSTPSPPTARVALARKPSLKSHNGSTGSTGSTGSNKGVKWRKEQAVVIGPEPLARAEDHTSPEVVVRRLSRGMRMNSTGADAGSWRKSAEFQRKDHNNSFLECFAGQNSNLVSDDEDETVAESEKVAAGATRPESPDADFRKLCLRRSLQDLQNANPEDLKAVLSEDKNLVQTLHRAVVVAPTARSDLFSGLESPTHKDMVDETSEMGSEVDSPPLPSDITPGSRQRIKELRKRQRNSIKLLQTPREKRHEVLAQQLARRTVELPDLSPDVAPPAENDPAPPPDDSV